MTSHNVTRKLAAILSADVKGYSRLMGEDEEWTVHTLNSSKDMMKGLIELDPLSGNAHYILGLVLFLSGQFDQAIEVLLF